MTRPSETMQELRADLAACYRLCARFGMDDTIYTHISARAPGALTGRGDGFLINPYGFLFDEIDASSLCLVDMDGAPIDAPHEVNPAGFTIHSAVYAARPDVACVMHTHTLSGMAVAASPAGLLPLNQISMEFTAGLAYHDYEGIALDLDERTRIQRDLGGAMAMILRHHGLLTVGRTIAEAFYLHHYLDRACALQVAALSADPRAAPPAPDVVAHAEAQFGATPDLPKGERLWRALVRRLDREAPDYRR